MNYIVFNNEIYQSDGFKVNKLEKDTDLGSLLSPVDSVSICVVDVDILIASASERALDKKDGTLAKKFGENFHGDYILQDEKIGDNIFQVIGIKSEKVREVYSLIQSERIKTFVPYAIALRNYLTYQKIPLNRSAVIFDDWGHEKFITIFEGLKFSRTRTIYQNNAEQILSEIKRSIINFEKKLGEQKDKSFEGYLIVTNNKVFENQTKSIERDLKIKVIDSVCPAIEGLKIGGFNLKYILPEEIIKRRKGEESRKRNRSLIISILLSTFSIVFYFYNELNLDLAKKFLAQEQARESTLKENLNRLDPNVYRNAINQQKKLNYALVYFNISNSLPLGFKTYSVHFYNKSNHWIIEEYLYTSDDEMFDDIILKGVLKKAQIKDYWVENGPGKYLRVEL